MNKIANHVTPRRWHILILLALALLVYMVLSSVEDPSLRSWLSPEDVPTARAENRPQPQESQQKAPTPTDTDTAADPTGIPNLSPDYQQLRTLILDLPGARRHMILTRPKAFQQLIRDELAARSMVAMAWADGLHKDAATTLSIQRRSHQVLRERLRAGYLRQNIPAGYPSEDEMRAYYDSDPSRFNLPQRIQVRQIFLNATEPDQEQEILAEAQNILDRILAGELTFQAAATTYSEHLPSRYRGGYVGLLALPEIDAAIRPTLLNLPPGVPGGPKRGTQGGYHIVQRGELFPEVILDFERARPLVRQHMLEQRRRELYQELTRQATRVYPYSVEGKLVEQWWTRMRAEAGL